MTEYIEPISLAMDGLFLFAALGSALCWVKAGSVAIPDNIDTIVREMRRAARWSKLAAYFAAIAAVVAAAGTAVPWLL